MILNYLFILGFANHKALWLTRTEKSPSCTQTSDSMVQGIPHLSDNLQGTFPFSSSRNI